MWWVVMADDQAALAQSTIDALVRMIAEDKEGATKSVLSMLTDEDAERNLFAAACAWGKVVGQFVPGGDGSLIVELERTEGAADDPHRDNQASALAAFMAAASNSDTAGALAIWKQLSAPIPGESWQASLDRTIELAIDVLSMAAVTGRRFVEEARG